MPAQVERSDDAVTITGPKLNISDLVTQHGLVAPPGGPDPVNAWTATLQQIAANNGGVLPVPTFTRTVRLYDAATCALKKSLAEVPLVR